MTNPHMLSAIAADPDDDTRRLAYADWLDENGDNDRAELIRVQCEAERIRGGGCAVVLGAECDGSKEWCIRCRHIKRSNELIAANPEWTQWPCPTCFGRGRVFESIDPVFREYQSIREAQMASGPVFTARERFCSVCNGAGDLLKSRRITWDRGWPGWVHVDRVSELVTRQFVSVEPVDEERQGGIVEMWEQKPHPTPLLTALATTPLWGVPLRGVIVAGLEPHVWHAPVRYGWLVDSVHYGRSAIPDTVFRCIEGGNARRTPREAVLALAAAFLTFGRKHS